jgi:hypothetical protein
LFLLLLLLLLLLFEAYLLGELRWGRCALESSERGVREPSEPNPAVTGCVDV